MARVIDASWGSMQPITQQQVVTGTSGASTSGQNATLQQPSQFQQAGESLLKSGLKSGGFMGTGMADSLNSGFNFVTGRTGGISASSVGAPAAGTRTFGGTNIGYAGAGLAGGYIGDWAFGGEGASGLGGSLGGTAGYGLATGSGAIGSSLASMGAFAGPIGVIGGALLGGAIGSLFGGGDDPDFRFRTYSGQLGSELSPINIDRARIADGELAKLKRYFGATDRESYDWGVKSDLEQYATTSDSFKIAMAKYNRSEQLATFDYNAPLTDKYVNRNYASFDGPFGKYTVGHVDDIGNPKKFAQNWVDSVEQLDTAFASILTDEQIKLAKEGLSGSVQHTRDWEKEWDGKIRTENMLADRYIMILSLAGRDDLAKSLHDSMEIDQSEDRFAEGRNGIEAITSVLLEGGYNPQSSTQTP